MARHGVKIRAEFHFNVKILDETDQVKWWFISNAMVGIPSLRSKGKTAVEDQVDAEPPLSQH